MKACVRQFVLNLENTLGKCIAVSDVTIDPSGYLEYKKKNMGTWVWRNGTMFFRPVAAAKHIDKL